MLFGRKSLRPLLLLLNGLSAVSSGRMEELSVDWSDWKVVDRTLLLLGCSSLFVIENERKNRYASVYTRGQYLSGIASEQR